MTDGFLHEVRHLRSWSCTSVKARVSGSSVKQEHHGMKQYTVIRLQLPMSHSFLRLRSSIRQIRRLPRSTRAHSKVLGKQTTAFSLIPYHSIVIQESHKRINTTTTTTMSTSLDQLKQYTTVVSWVGCYCTELAVLPCMDWRVSMEHDKQQGGARHQNLSWYTVSCYVNACSDSGDFQGECFFTFRINAIISLHKP